MFTVDFRSHSTSSERLLRYESKRKFELRSVDRVEIMVVETMESATRTEEVDAEYGTMDVDAVTDEDADVAADNKIRRDCRAGPASTTETAAEVSTGVEFEVMGTEATSGTQSEMETDSTEENPSNGVK